MGCIEGALLSKRPKFFPNSVVYRLQLLYSLPFVVVFMCSSSFLSSSPSLLSDLHCLSCCSGWSGCDTKLLL